MLKQLKSLPFRVVEPNKQIQTLLVMIVAFNTVPHTVHLPLWTTIASMSFLIWSALHLFRHFPLPPKFLRVVLTVAGPIAVFLQWGTILGQEPATGLLVYLAALKLLETNYYRDAMLVIFTSYFLLMAHLLVSQSLPSTLYMGLDVMLITSLMFHIHNQDRRQSLRSFRPALRLLTLALPIWIFLFIVFPRFTTGFWNLNSKQLSQSRFSDNLDPGSVSSLIDSEETAFRVTFKVIDSLRQDDLYWRGAIAHYNDSGLHWVANVAGLPREDFADSHMPGSIIQEIVLEPQFGNWLFALDAPQTLIFSDPLKNMLIRQGPGQIFSTTQPVESRVMYEAVSNTIRPKQKLSQRERLIFLQVPTDMTNDVRQLADRLRHEGHGDTQAKVDRVLKWYSDEGFRYSKSPGRLKTGLLREFLFDTKVGFCEHYAASFATLMRLMGIPSRVILGFQGGMKNAYGGYLVVRQLDAHAWTEIYNAEESRWQRVDPTATIVPLRISLGGDFNRMDQSLAARLTPEMISSGATLSSFSRFGRNALFAWDAVAMRWNNLLLRYDFEYQQELFSKMGFSSANRIVFFIWVTTGIFIFVIGLQLAFRYRARREDPLLKGYHRLCHRLEKSGLARLPGEGPLAFLERAIRFAPDQAEQLHKLTHEYIELRYGPCPKEGLEEKDFHARIGRFATLARQFRIKVLDQP